MTRLFRYLSITLLGLMLGAVVPNARATQLDFTCSASCGGAVTVTGSNYMSSSTITVKNSDGAVVPPSWVPPPVSAWTLAFDTSLSTISLTSTGVLGTLSGVIQSFGVFEGSKSSNLTLQVLWNSLPPDVVTFFGGATSADDVTSVIYLGNKTTSGPVNSVGLTMFPSPTPEPGSLILLGSGFLTVCAFLRKKLGSQGEV